MRVHLDLEGISYEFKENSREGRLVHNVRSQGLKGGVAETKETASFGLQIRIAVERLQHGKRRLKRSNFSFKR